MYTTCGEYRQINLYKERGLTYRGNAFRVVCRAQIGAELWVVHAPQKKSTQGIKTLDRDGLAVRAAHARTGIAAADVSRIRNGEVEGDSGGEIAGGLKR